MPGLGDLIGGSWLFFSSKSTTVERCYANILREKRMNGQANGKWFILWDLSAKRYDMFELDGNVVYMHYYLKEDYCSLIWIVICCYFVKFVLSTTSWLKWQSQKAKIIPPSIITQWVSQSVKSGRDFFITFIYWFLFKFL